MDKKIVISAQNIYEGGPLTILNIAVESLIERIKKNHLIIFVSNKNLIDKKIRSKNIKIIEIPNSRKNFLYRIYYEFLYFKKFSKKEKPDIWISLQDILPNVDAKKKIVYCHTPIAFYDMKMRDIYFEPFCFFRSMFYKFIYNTKVYKKSTIIVQQEWIKNIFKTKFRCKNIIVNKPFFNFKENNKYNYKKKNNDIIFFYQSLPRFQKNFEVIVKACKFLNKPIKKFKIYFTFSKNENRYSKYISKISKNVPQIKFIGRKKHVEILKIYKKTSLLIFSSKLETWGLPLSEAMYSKIPIIASNMSYARETLLGYKKKIFFDPDNHIKLANILNNFLLNKKLFKNNNKNFIIKNNLHKLWSVIL